MILGIWEMAVVFVVALLVLGPERMPQLARGLARLVRQLQHIAEEVRRGVDADWLQADEVHAATPAPNSATPAPDAEADGAAGGQLPAVDDAPSGAADAAAVPAEAADAPAGSPPAGEA